MTKYLTPSWQRPLPLHRLLKSIQTTRSKEEAAVMATQVLFIAGTAHAQWGGVLQEALGANCIVNPATPCDYANRIRKNRFDLIIIDAGELDYFAEIVHDVQQLQPDVKVIVATASPTWQRAREAMRAGAFDYIRKDQKKSRLARYLHTVLEK